ncbi:DSBA-like thioredoxin domain-containing protein [Pedococcus dokdonensis]|uniref:DSBA-like thioredoxin domain-containing protein n=1 Tax=Pedococcus dokdonensis TaxID=443156 RepID=A0A1H0TP86_9MICO|nr:DsbA family protein [Pedococcus dokdonensis]SDP55458.1 DSBA-like thioredoxin domain-containing protein [Pedococcus dokdonensis]
MSQAPHGCRCGIAGWRTPTQSGLGARCTHEPAAVHRSRADLRRLIQPHGRLVSPGDLPLTGTELPTLLVYVMDIYDPASWAYLPSVSAVLGSVPSGVEVEVVQSGRLAARAPAACLIALLAAGELPVSTVLEAVQHAYFVESRPLDSPGVVESVAEALGLDGPAVAIFARSSRARELAAEDFELARDLDLGGGPLLLASRGEHVFEFDGPGASGDRLVDQFRTVQTRP